MIRLTSGEPGERAAICTFYLCIYPFYDMHYIYIYIYHVYLRCFTFHHLSLFILSGEPRARRDLSLTHLHSACSYFLFVFLTRRSLLGPDEISLRGALEAGGP